MHHKAQTFFLDLIIENITFIFSMEISVNYNTIIKDTPTHTADYRRKLSSQKGNNLSYEFSLLKSACTTSN